MDNKYDVTIPLNDYNKLIENNIRYGDLLKKLKQVMKNTDRLNWKKEDLDLPDDVIRIIKEYWSFDYSMRVSEIKKELEKENDK